MCGGGRGRRSAYEKSSVKRDNGAPDFGIGEFDMSRYSLGEDPASFYTEEIQNSWADDYNDAAIVMLTREGAEGTDLQIEDPTGQSQLALHQEEKDLLNMIRDSGKFDKVIVLVNSGWAMELDWLEEYGVDACLWIGLPGQRGFEGVVNLLTGKANPSGRLQDTYAASSTSSPAVVNAGGNRQVWTNLEEVDQNTKDQTGDLSYYTVYAESIYSGYKYYETRYEDSVLGQGNADSKKGSSNGGAWDYSSEVTFPFGYGLSYTTFEQSLDSVEMKDDTIDVTVTVKNTGNTAGKSVVQIYAQTPYGDYEKKNQVEKSSVVLMNFGKTDLLEPGDSQTLVIPCEKYFLASYDYVGAKGYVMSEGDYYIAVGDDAHDALNNVLSAKGAEGLVDANGDTVTGDKNKTYRWTEQFDDSTYRQSRYTENEVSNKFDEEDLNHWIEDAVTYLSRQDWDATWPTKAVQVAATPEMMEVLDGEYYVKSEDALKLSDFTQGDNQGIPLAGMMGLAYDDPQWETYLNQFTIDQLGSLLRDASGTAEIPEVGVPQIKIGDGPDGIDAKFTEYGDDRDACCYPCELILFSTFNKDLMGRRGELIGEEYRYIGANDGWLPGVNLHRTPFGGRNAEYFSEDANASYICSIPYITGFQSKGLNAGPKHLLSNDQETNRAGISTFMNEQTLREGDLRGVEGALAVAGSNLIMHGYNRFGMKWCSSSYELCTDLLVNEWGFEGKQISDCIAAPFDYFIHFASSLMAGTDCYCLDFEGKSGALVKQIKDTDDGDLLRKLREAAHDSLYIAANSALMDGYSADSRVVSVVPWWKTAMKALIVVLVILDALCIVMIIRNKKEQNVQKEN